MPQQLSFGYESASTSPSQASAEQRRQLREAERQARCAEVLRLHAQGFPILTIARQLHMHRRLVRQYLRVGVLPRVHSAVIIPPRSTAVLGPTTDTEPSLRDRHIQKIQEKGRRG